MEDLKNRAEIVLKKLDIEGKRTRFREIEAKSTDPEFWKDNQTATKLMQEMGLLQKEISSYEKIHDYYRLSIEIDQGKGKLITAVRPCPAVSNSNSGRSG